MSHETRTPRSRYRWDIQAPVPPEQIKQYPNLDPLVVQLLHNRGITSADDIEAFLAGTPDDDNPFRLRGMNEAVTRIRQAISQGERIAVYGDFDVDGVTSTALLVQVLQALGADVEPYIPHRIDEGYGLNTGALDELAARGIRLIITVDCGVRAMAEVTHAQRLAMDTIITDHHEPPDILPPALALINPRQPGCRYNFKDLPGVGLAFKLAQALMRVQRRVPLRDENKPRSRSSARPAGGGPGPLSEDDLLDLVALGIVADLAPLVGENRALVQRGLVILNRVERIGIRALMEVAGVQPGLASAETIGYVLGPRLNAAGRLDHAMLAFRLLTSQDPAEAQQLATKLDASNRERQALTNTVLEEALLQIKGREEAYFLIAYGEDFVPGVVGLVASRLTEQFYRPSLVLEVSGDTSHGSARSIPEFNIVKALDKVGDLLIKYGGHAAAAGLTIATEKLDELQHQLYRIAAQSLASVELVPTLTIDAEWPLSRLAPQTFHTLSSLRPFGIGNPAPRLLARDVRLRHSTSIGEKDHHLRLKLEQNRVIWDAIAFRQGHWAGHLPEYIDIVYTPKIEIWNGQERLQLEISDLRPSRKIHER